MHHSKTYKSVTIWLFIGCLMVLFQILIGGITRLTDSGLSITEWNVVKGTLPPMNAVEWQESFEKYKSFAKKQFESIHREMTLQEFKTIYFWEYFHRLWARFMGFVFILPFFYFLLTKKLPSRLLKRLGIVILLASLSAVFGWLMVASGLNNDQRTWVNAYNLLIHLLLASSLFSYLIYTIYHYTYSRYYARIEIVDIHLLKFLGVLLVLQLSLGALVAGMKAALVFPYPLVVFKIDVLTEILKNNPITSMSQWFDYEPNPSIKLYIQLVHRLVGYSILGVSIWLFISNKAKMFIAPSFLLFYILLFIQIGLGICTVMYSVGGIPLVFGVLHQMTAFLLLASYLWILFSSKKRR